MYALCFLLLLLAACAPSGPPEVAVASAVETARGDSAELGKRIRGLLTEQLAEGSLPGAIAACSNLAQSETEDFSRATGHPIRRVSVKYRNPNDKPDEWEAARLDQLAQQLEAGQTPAETWEVMRINGNFELRYLKPILVEPVCLTCHGEASALAPTVRDVIAANYPDDLATGYKAGDLRGAFSVRIPLQK
jgi:hypothetical protein